MYDYLIIGSGVAGSVCARRLAEKNKKVLILEKRNHIAGNCFDEKDKNGVLIHTYGPHIFHTNDEEVYEFLSRFTEWYMYENGHTVVAKVGDKLLPIPFNMNTLYQVYGDEKGKVLEAKLKESYGEGSRVGILELRKNEDEEIRQIADFVYENVFLKYTMKQWGQRPEDISPEVTARVPVVITNDNRYFADKYQGVPLEGFTKLFENMLNHPNIEVRTGVDCKEVLRFVDGKITALEEDLIDSDTKIIYTGEVDKLFDNCFGGLPYRSLRFEFEHLDKEDFQNGHSVVNYTVSEDFTRITEFKYLTGQKDCEGTTIVREYPFAYTGAENETPYYAIMNEENNALYLKYKALTEDYSNLYLLGRLAEYKYYNIDLMAKKAMELADKI